MDPLKIPAIKEVLKDIPETGIIELKALGFKDAKGYVEPTKDSTTGQLLGVPRLSEDDKKLVSFHTHGSTRLTVKDGYTFNMEVYQERLLWAMSKHSILIGMSFDEAQNTPGAKFYVNNEEEKLKDEMDYENKLFEATTLIHNDSAEERIARARLLGIDMTGETGDTAKKQLLRVMREKQGVDKILNLYKSSAINTTIVFFKATERGIIKEVNGVFMYGQLPLGVDQEKAIEYLQASANADLLKQIKKEINPEIFANADAD